MKSSKVSPSLKIKAELNFLEVISSDAITGVAFKKYEL